MFSDSNEIKVNKNIEEQKKLFFLTNLILFIALLVSFICLYFGSHIILDYYNVPKNGLIPEENSALVKLNIIGFSALTIYLCFVVFLGIFSLILFGLDKINKNEILRFVFLFRYPKSWFTGTNSDTSLY